MNDLLEVNIRGIRKLYDMFSNARCYTFRNRREVSGDKPSIDQITQLLRDPQYALFNFGLTDFMIVKSFFLAKMTIVLETENSNFEYTFIHWPEFLEFLPRLAWIKYQSTYQHNAWSLRRKTKVTIDLLFKMIHETAVDAPHMR